MTARAVKRLLTEPLLHFLVLGALLFAGYRMVSRHETGPERLITVSRGEIDTMSAGFSSTYQRPPTDEEIKGLIDAYVREEILVREGVAMGLDRDDPMIRSRVRMKMEILVEEGAGLAEPSDAELQAYFD
ncbi:MAG TPA: peptidyl-prolyl cis-trans isomerase, partial [Candidatus Polarisedimenticolia bacterium]|nr:peptidyl-prolyl cis-trans isomerase [Candidatus Polarisedimenticolia bacterium]